ncbi:UDP-glucose 4-epimerase GalE [Microlunatus flavus]|uniref:UDP-glucose 4-epimerase GalE n=1 Tax=Microlunatus flavus TaxID=1036181 RepID=UPI000B84C676|nr:UDP-glucose 4-epimerase GalE [Microlunatus flavus]
MAGARWLVTGGAGYIGAHVVRSLLASGRTPVVLDDLSTGLDGRVPAGVELVSGSVLDEDLLTDALAEVDGVVHLAGKKSPTESVADPLRYARENVGGVVSLTAALRRAGCARVVFSSSCSVYGTPTTASVDEDAPTTPESPYGDSKLYGERLLHAAGEAYGLGVVSLRYFNVVGAAEPALADTGAHNLVPLVVRAVLEGRRPQVFGDDWPTPDGTCVRDYVDVRDVADAHVAAAAALERAPRLAAYNVGQGTGSSVLEVLAVLRETSGADFGHDVLPRRPGDPAAVVGRVDRIAAELGWTARHDLRATLGSAWRAATAVPASASR